MINLFGIALNYVSNKLRKDAELKRTYIDNIAMSFYDEFNKQRSDDGYYVTKKEAHEIANNAAENFMYNFLKK